MDDRQLLRYSRHLLLDDIGVEGQQRLLDARALVVGAGGLGSPVALYLASAGVGQLTLVDDDTVDLTNLQRQIMHTEARIGQAKVASAQAAIHAINPEVRVHTVARRADETLFTELAASADVVLDCTDNFATRQALNRACVATGRPLVSGAAIGFDGQVSVFDLRQPDSPCYACVFPPSQTVEEARCATGGHHRHAAGGRGAEAAGRRRAAAAWPPADAGGAPDGMDRIARAAPVRLPGVPRSRQRAGRHPPDRPDVGVSHPAGARPRCHNRFPDPQASPRRASS